MLFRSAVKSKIAVGASAQNDEESNNDKPKRSSGNVKLVERDRSGSVDIFFEKVRQGFTEVGKVKSDETSDGHTRVKIYSLNDELIAEATCVERIMCKKISILTFKDNELHEITVGGIDDKEEKVAQFLVKRGYL